MHSGFDDHGMLLARGRYGYDSATSAIAVICFSIDLDDVNITRAQRPLGHTAIACSYCVVHSTLSMSPLIKCVAPKSSLSSGLLVWGF
jgi:hypothetical protein